MASPKRQIWLLSFVGLLWPCAGFADEAGEWYGRLGGLAALYDSSAKISTPMGTIPGATANVSNNPTAIVDLGYDVTPNIFVMLMGGAPPTPKINARGSITPIGELGAVTYGPAVLTTGYRIPFPGGLQPYVGAGVAYAIMLADHDAAVSDLKVQNNFGFALQAGVEYPLSDRWQAFVDVKQLWLSVDAKGALDNVVPVRARVQLNPTLVSVGVKLRLN